MHIKELQLLGFKSFQDKTTLRFSPGVNAIIGPNGCGKTNVLDALRWVLGEQSFTVLRCGRTEDVVFGGTATVPPLNFAEVKLVLANEGDAELGAEIEIKRRYFRSGESEYFLNRQSCRLKDIQEVFLSSGTGTRAYSIFDLRQMREIISGNVRKMFEEAATLAKYQDAKDDCQRKLALTESDLLRLEDIIVERERFVRSLQRQAAKLKAYDRLKGEEKNLRLLELKDEDAALGRELERAQTDADAMEQAEAVRVAEIHRLDEELKVHRSKLRNLQSYKDEVADRVREHRACLADLESRSLLARQRIDFLTAAADRAAEERRALLESTGSLERAFAENVARLTAAAERAGEAQQALERMREETRADEEKLYALKSHESALRSQLQELLEQQVAFKSELAKCDAQHENQAEARTRLDEERAALERRTTEVAAELARLEQELAAAQVAVAEQTRRSEALRTELAGLRARRDELAAAANSLRQERARREKELAVLRAKAGAEQTDACRKVFGDTLLGEVSQFLHIRPGWERACEAALYAVADFVITTTGAGPARFAELESVRPDLRFGMLQLDNAADPELAGAPADDAVLSPLVQYVDFDPMTPEPLRRMVRQCLVAQSAAELERLARAFPSWTFVTRDGACRFSDGRLVLAGREQGRLSAARQMDENTVRLAAIEHELARLEAEDRTAVDRRDEAENELGARAVEIGDLGRQAASLDATRSAVAGQLEELARDRERLAAGARAIDAQQRTVTGRIDETGRQAGETAARVETTTAALTQLAHDVVERERRVRAGLERSAEALAELSRARETVSRLETEGAFAKRAIDDARRRVAELEAAAAAHHDEVTVLERETADRSMEVELARTRLETHEVELAQVQMADLVRAEEELDRNLNELRAGQEQHQGLLLDQRLKLRELALRRDAVADEARTSYGTEIAQFEPAEAGGVADRLASVRRRLEALGQVNPLAGQEYAQEKQDLEKLRQQRDDVGSARENLIQTLTEIDRHARDQFVATYSEVRTHFQRIFRELFLEGEADLVLVNDANPLESEIAIVAKPRGKNPKRLEQLSDGEKAMLAVSLLFAFYEVKPAPFCFLDEVDAPLDDVNVGRFSDYLRTIARNTQVVIITHNRLTVERADVVFGVTAEEPGISKLISVRLAEYRAAPEPVAAPA